MSASFETRIRSLSFAYSHTSGSSCRFQVNISNMNRVWKEIFEKAHQACTTSSRQRAASCGGHSHKLTLTVSGKGNARFQIFTSQVGKILEDFFFRHIGGKLLQNLVHRNSQTADTRLSATLVGVNCNVILVVHDLRLRLSHLCGQDLA